MASALAPLLQAGTELSKSVIAQISGALNTSLWTHETVRTTRKGVVTRRASIPAWLVVGGLVGGAVTLWILGLGVGVHDQKVSWTERPRITLPFAPRAGGQAGEGFIPDWVPIFGVL